MVSAGQIGLVRRQPHSVADDDNLVEPLSIRQLQQRLGPAAEGPDTHAPVGPLDVGDEASTRTSSTHTSNRDPGGRNWFSWSTTLGPESLQPTMSTRTGPSPSGRHVGEPGERDRAAVLRDDDDLVTRPEHVRRRRIELHEAGRGSTKKHSSPAKSKSSRKTTASRTVTSAMTRPGVTVLTAPSVRMRTVSAWVGLESPATMLVREK